MYYNDSSKTKSQVIGIIKNGNRSSLKSVHVGSKNFIVSNTCAFDSIVHVLCTSYCDSKTYSDFINENNNFPIFKLVSNVIKNGINVQTYRKRIMIMKDICELQELPEKLYCIQGNSTIEVMTRKLLGCWPSRVDNQNCIKCPHQTINQQPIIIYLNDISNLDKLFAMDGNFNKCNNCNRRLTNPYKYGTHIFMMTTPTIDFSNIPVKDLSGEELISNKNSYISGVQLKLQDIPKILTIKRQKYKIRGAINLIQPSCVDIGSSGHYEAYCFREGTGYWELFDDLKNKPIRVKENININSEMIIYTV